MCIPAVILSVLASTPLFHVFYVMGGSAFVGHTRYFSSSLLYPDTKLSLSYCFLVLNTLWQSLALSGRPRHFLLPLSASKIVGCTRIFFFCLRSRGYISSALPLFWLKVMQLCTYSQMDVWKEQEDGLPLWRLPQPHLFYPHSLATHIPLGQWDRHMTYTWTVICTGY